MFPVRFCPPVSRQLGTSGWRRAGPASFSRWSGRGDTPPLAVTLAVTRYRSFMTPSTTKSPAHNSTGNGELGRATIFLTCFAGTMLGWVLGVTIESMLFPPAPSPASSTISSPQTSGSPSSITLSSLSAQVIDEDTDTCVYASPEQTREAIAELHTIFATSSSSTSNNNTAEELGSDKVSTDPDDLHNHGFSANDHYPGVHIIEIFCTTRFTDS
jgi:hypothetical protein